MPWFFFGEPLTLESRKDLKSEGMWRYTREKNKQKNNPFD